MKTKILFPASLAMLMFAGMTTGCHDDDGNYSYTELDNIDITTEGFGDSEDGDVLTIDRGDPIQIDPDVYFNGKLVSDNDDAPLRYLWTFYSANTGIGVDYTIDTLATTRQLDAVINRTGGTYIAQLTVTNTNTGLESYYKATCNVSESVSGGWMLLYERADMPGYSDVGLIVNPFTKKNIQKNKEFWDLYSSSNGSPLPGKPVNIFHVAMPLPTGSDQIATDRTISIVSPADFTQISSWDDLFYEVPQADNIQYFGTSTMATMCETMIMNNSLRLLTTSAMGGGTGYFSLPKRSDVEIGELAQWSAKRCMGNTFLETVVYSQTNGTFYFNTGTLDLKQFPAQDPNAPFDLNNMDGARLLFGDYGGNNEDFMLFAKDDKRYIGIARFSTRDCISSTNIAQTYTDVSAAPGITEATSFATNNMAYFAYYSSGNKVYNIACQTGATTEVWTAPDPTEIVTCVRTHKFYFSSMAMLIPNPNSVVHIATWNESTKQGKLYEYKINPANGQIFTNGDSYEYTVPGKVKDMSQKFELVM